MGYLFYLVKGEFGPKVAKTFNLKNFDGTAYDLTGLTNTLKYKRTDAAGSLVSRTSPDLLVVGSATLGVLKWTPKAEDTTTPGNYHADFELVDGSNNEVLPKFAFNFKVKGKVE